MRAAGAAWPRPEPVGLSARPVAGSSLPAPCRRRSSTLPPLRSWFAPSMTTCSPPARPLSITLESPCVSVDGDRRHLDGRVGADDVHERAVSAPAGPPPRARRPRPCVVSTSTRALTNAFGHSTCCGFGTIALSLIVAVDALTWLSRTASVPVAEHRRAVAVVDLDRDARRARAPSTIVGQPILRQREDHRGRIDRGDHDEAGRIGRRGRGCRRRPGARR